LKDFNYQASPNLNMISIGRILKEMKKKENKTTHTYLTTNSYKPTITTIGYFK